MHYFRILPRYWYLMGGILLLVSIAFVFWGSATFADSIERYSLNVSDLPQEAQVVSDQYSPLDDDTHPLWQYVDLGTSEASSFSAVYKIIAFLPVEGVSVANYQYQYSSAQDAQQSYTRFRDDIVKFSGFSVLDSVDSIVVQGEILSAVGPEGDTVQWFVGTRGNILTLLMVNGFDSESVDQTIQDLLLKVIDKK